MCRVVGVFTSIDPLWEQYRGWSPYQYAGNNPIMALDWNGKEVYPQNLSDRQLNSYFKLMDRLNTWALNSKVIKDIMDQVQYEYSCIDLYSIEPNINNESIYYSVDVGFSGLLGFASLQHRFNGLFGFGSLAKDEAVAAMTFDHNTKSDKIIGIFSTYIFDSDYSALILLDEFMHAIDGSNTMSEKKEHFLLYNELQSMIENGSLKVSPFTQDEINKKYKQFVKGEK